MACASCWSSTVLPAFGGATMRQRWPLPIGDISSMTRGSRIVGLGLERETLVGVDARTSSANGHRLGAVLLGRHPLDGRDARPGGPRRPLPAAAALRRAGRSPGANGWRGRDRRAGRRRCPGEVAAGAGAGTPCRPRGERGNPTSAGRSPAGVLVVTAAAPAAPATRPPATGAVCCAPRARRRATRVMSGLSSNIFFWLLNTCVSRSHPPDMGARLASRRSKGSGTRR